MADRDILERIDRHLERGDELMEQIREEVRLSREQYERLYGEMRDFTSRLQAESRDFTSRLQAESRDFMREITLRIERIGRDELRELHELREETRAEREGFLRLIERMDRFDPGGAAA